MLVYTMPEAWEFLVEKSAEAEPACWIRPVGVTEFKFWADLTPEEREQLIATRNGRRRWRPPKPHPTPEIQEEEPEGPTFVEPGEFPTAIEIQPPTRSRPTLPKPTVGGSDRYILDENWSESYETCPHFGPIWQACHDPTKPWPQGIQVLSNKMYEDGRLCVPENKVEGTLWAHHVEAGHPGIQKLVLATKTHYSFPPHSRVEETIRSIRRTCLVCQACDSPNTPLVKPLRMNPVVEGFFTSVSLDIFSMPRVEWLGEPFDCILLCVDRTTNWVVARPSCTEGLTGEKAAHLLLDGAWGEIGVPSIVTSDQGAQFISQWFRTLCARLGVRQSFSQAYRPQANGRAEVAGRTVRNVLRKIHADHEVNWVQALPQVLRLRHDMPNPETGLSPYQLLFGRERPLAGLPYTFPRAHPEATELFDFIEKCTVFITEKLRQELKKEEDQVNRKRHSEIYIPGQWVWIHRPTAYSGVKMQTAWVGPYKIAAQTGEHSFVVEVSPRILQEVHMDQMKPCLSMPSMRAEYPMVYRKGDTPILSIETQIKNIPQARHTPEGVELFVEWEGQPGGGVWMLASRLGGVVY